MITLIYGNEPYLMDVEKKKIFTGNPLDENNVSSLEEVWRLVYMPALMQEKRRIALELETLGADEKFENFLHTMVENPSTVSKVFVFAKAVNKNTKVFKLMQKHFHVTVCNKLTEEKLRAFICREIQSAGGQITKDAYRIFAERLSYASRDECSLYTVKTVIQQILQASGGSITPEIVSQFLPETIEEKVYKISSYVVAGNEKRAIQAILTLSDNRESMIGVLSCMISQFRIAYKVALCGSEGVGASPFQYQPFKGISPGQAKSVMCVLQKAVNDIKRGQPEKTVAVTAVAKCIKLGFKR